MCTMTKHLFLILLTLAVATQKADTSANPAIDRAMRSVEAAVPKAERDPTRPVYHFRPPAQWMNDPNGTIYHKGYYHVFYQHNPYGDEWGHMHWGHTRSKDLVHWEHLPIALWPSEERGEAHCFSGCARINGKGEPMIFYTKVPPRSEKSTHEQWAAIGDDELIEWKKHPANPILNLETHGGPKFGGAWRDPFIFQEADRTFMVLGADLGGEAVIPIYEAEDTDLARWAYRGILFRLPKEDLKFFECPNFFKLDNKWVLLCSPYRPVEYFIGSFNPETLTFKPETRGILDRGNLGTANFYASNILFDDRGRCVLLGWVRGFKKGRGWNGCLALPRLLSIGPDGRPRQKPVPELQKLRGKHVEFSDTDLNDSRRILENVQGDALEIIALFQPGDAKAFGLKVRRSENGNAVTIRHDGETLDVAGTKVPFKSAEHQKTLELHVFLDKSVLEVFVNGGRACVTGVIYPGEQDLGVELFAEGGSVRVRSLDIWEMKSIW